MTPRSANKAGKNRAVKGDSPHVLKAVSKSQKVKGGFSNWGWPKIKGVNHSFLAAISLAVWQ